MLEVTELEFHNLKKEQSLLVDFGSFSQKFVELLKLCMNDEHFYASLNLKNDPILNILERNQFRNLSHLSVKFQTANDSLLKQYLASRLKLSLGSTEVLSKKLATVESILSDVENRHKLLCKNHENLKKETTAELENTRLELQNKLDSAILEEKNKSLKKLQNTEESLSKDSESVKKDLEMKLKVKLEELERVQNENMEYKKKQYEIENENMNLKNRVLVSNESDQSNLSELQRLRDENRKLNVDLMSTKTEEGKNNVLLTSFKEQLHDKTENLTKTTQLLSSLQQSQKELEEKVNLYRKTVKSLQKKLEISINEINKGNEVIERLQGEIKTQKLRIKNKNIVIRQQEKHVDEISAEKDLLERKNMSLKNQVSNEENRTEKLQDSLKEVEKKLNDAKDTIESNQNVINYLNKQINRNQMGNLSDSNFKLLSPTMRFDDRESRLNIQRLSGGLSSKSKDGLVDNVERTFDELELEKYNFDNNLNDLMNQDEMKLPPPEAFDDIDEQNISEILAS